MGQCQIVAPAASWKLIFSIQPHARPGTTLNSFERCLKIMDTFRRLVKRAEERKGSRVRDDARPAFAFARHLAFDFA